MSIQELCDEVQMCCGSIADKAKMIKLSEQQRDYHSDNGARMFGVAFIVSDDPKAFTESDQVLHAAREGHTAVLISHDMYIKLKQGINR